MSALWRRLLIAFGLLLALAQLFRAFHGARTYFITNDGAWYYANLASVYFDRDLDLSDQMATWRQMVREPPLALPAGRPTPTAYGVGPAVFWLPAFAAADLGVLVARQLGAQVPRNGYSLPYQLAAALATLVYGLLGVWLAFQAALWWCGEEAAAWPNARGLGVATALCASPALYYLVFEPTMAHGLSIFAASLLLWLWLKAGHTGRWHRWAMVGFAGGLCALIRPQDCLLLVLPMSTIARFRPATLVSGASALIVGAGLGFLPQALAWQATFGRPFALPQGPEFLLWTRPAVLQVWFSPHHGLFTWTPIWLFALAGLLTTPKVMRPVAIAALVVFLLESYVNGAARDWWAGDAFGARRFLSLFPVFAVGLSSIACRLGRRPAWFLVVSALAISANLALMAAYVTGRVPHG